jgi:hypothetical protein
MMKYDMCIVNVQIYLSTQKFLMSQYQRVHQNFVSVPLMSNSSRCWLENSILSRKFLVEFSCRNDDFFLDKMMRAVLYLYSSLGTTAGRAGAQQPFTGFPQPQFGGFRPVRHVRQQEKSGQN